MGAWNENKGKIGSIFPKEVETKNVDYLAQSIYDRVCRLYHKRDWNLEDFKDFRRAIASKEKTDLLIYGELILGILNLSPKNIEKELIILDTMYEGHVLEKRIKTGDIEHPYEIENRKPNKGDVVVIAQMVSGKMKQFVNNSIKDKISALESIGESTKMACEIISEELKEENSMFLEKLKEAYRQNFSYLRAHPVLEEFYSTSEEKILEEAMRNIRIELSKINKAEMALKDSYTKKTICKVMIEKQKQSKSRGKGFGVWHD